MSMFDLKDKLPGSIPRLNRDGDRFDGDKGSVTYADGEDIRGTTR